MSSCEKPLFLAILNETYTPGNQSAHIVRDWFNSIVGGVNGNVLNTQSMSKVQFLSTLKEVCKNHNIICFYLCVHGVQYRENGEIREKLKINEEVEIEDSEFTELINSLEFTNLYIFNESCHGAGLFNGIQLDKENTKLQNVIIFNVCSKEEKCFVRIIYSQSIGLICHFLFKNRINPFRSPEIAYDIIKKQYPGLQTTVTLLKNLN